MHYLGRSGPGCLVPEPDCQFEPGQGTSQLVGGLSVPMRHQEESGVNSSFLKSRVFFLSELASFPLLCSLQCWQGLPR